VLKDPFRKGKLFFVGVGVIMYYPLNFNVEWARKISGLFVLAYPDGLYFKS